LSNAPKESPIIVTFGEGYKSDMWSTPKIAGLEPEKKKPEEILQGYKDKCREAGRNCSFLRIADNGKPDLLATQICEIASKEKVSDVWMGGHDHADMMEHVKLKLKSTTLSSMISAMAPCNVHIIKDKEKSTNYPDRYLKANSVPADS